MSEEKLGYRNGQAAWRLWSADGALRTSLGSSGEDPALPIQGAQVRPLLRELDPTASARRPHVPQLWPWSSQINKLVLKNR